MDHLKPEELLYASTHEWVAVATADDGQKIATVGISKFAVEALTDLVFIDLPDVGRTVKAGESFGEIESVKAVSDLYSPVDGEVVAVNEKVRDSLDLLGQDPFGEGWLVKIAIADEAGLSNLLDHAAYQKQIADEQ